MVFVVWMAANTTSSAVDGPGQVAHRGITFSIPLVGLVRGLHLSRSGYVPPISLRLRHNLPRPLMTQLVTLPA